MVVGNFVTIISRYEVLLAYSDINVRWAICTAIIELFSFSFKDPGPVTDMRLLFTVVSWYFTHQVSF